MSGNVWCGRYAASQFENGSDMVMESLRRYSDVTGVAYTILFIAPHRKQSRGVSSGDRVGHPPAPTLPIHRSGYVASKGDGLQIWRVATNTVNKQSLSSNLGVGRRAKNSSPLADIIAIHGRLKRALVLDPSIRFERNLNQVTEVNIEKKSIYEPCLPYLSQKCNIPLKQ
ncbi:hypothetical protein ANN_01419 [Periplaneta americana]|uniref:Uncharacterized protein n=1 Tax=Periplaneta americana TaxID=6978 RepID=A0ABQ8TTH6_PERAM|nr:hypothetical protein ANN_01419 [Periplaneta americana]